MKETDVPTISKGGDTKRGSLENSSDGCFEHSFKRLSIQPLGAVLRTIRLMEPRSEASGKLPTRTSPSLQLLTVHVCAWCGGVLYLIDFNITEIDTTRHNQTTHSIYPYNPSTDHPLNRTYDLSIDVANFSTLVKTLTHRDFALALYKDDSLPCEYIH